MFAQARIDNRDELIATLGAVADPLSDEQLILAAYLRWGRDCAQRLIGDFAFVVWDSQARTLFAACDPMQMCTLYFAEIPEGLGVASSVMGLIRETGIVPMLDRIAITSWAAGWPDPNRSMFANLRMLPAGHWLWADASGVRMQKFWDIDPGRHIRYAAIGDYQDHLATLLRRCVGDRLRTAAPVIAAQLSGGMDSTSVCAMAVAALRGSDQRLVSLSHSYAATRECDESERIDETAQFLGIAQRHWLPAETHVDKDFRALYPPALESPGTVCSPRYADELALVQKIGADVLLTGSGGDEMVWGHSLTYTQRLRRGDLGVIAEVIRGSRAIGLPVLATLLQLFIRPLVPESLKRLRRRALRRPLESGLPAWIPQTAVRELDLYRVLFPASEVQFDNPALQARYDALKRTSTFNSVRSYERVASDFAVDVRHPFFDRRLAEFSFAIPDDLWLRENYPKWLLRRTMDGRLPDSVVWNRQKVTFNRFFGGVITNQADTIRAILSDTRLQDIGLVDNARLLAAFERVVASGGQQLNVDLLYALLTQVWFQQYADQFSLG